MKQYQGQGVKDEQNLKLKKILNPHLVAKGKSKASSAKGVVMTGF